MGRKHKQSRSAGHRSKKVNSLRCNDVEFKNPVSYIVGTITEVGGAYYVIANSTGPKPEFYIPSFPVSAEDNGREVSGYFSPFDNQILMEPRRDDVVFDDCRVRSGNVSVAPDSRMDSVGETEDEEDDNRLYDSVCYVDNSADLDICLVATKARKVFECAIVSILLGIAGWYFYKYLGVVSIVVSLLCISFNIYDIIKALEAKVLYDKRGAWYDFRYNRTSLNGGMQKV